MFFYRISAALCLFFLLLATGCTNLAQDTMVNVKVQTPKPVSELSARTMNTVQVGTINDFRGVGNSRLLMSKNYTGHADGAFLSTQNVTQLVQNILHNTLVQQHYTVLEKHADYILTGNLLKLDLSWQDAVLQSDLHGKSEIDFTLTRVNTGIPVWHRVFKANVGGSAYADFGMSAIIAHSVTQGLQKVMYQFERSVSFRNAIAEK
jgi:hypothetical protein